MGNELRERALARRNGNTPAQPASAGLVETDGNGGKHQAARTLADQIERKLAVFQDAMPKGLEARLLVRDAVGQIRQQPQLAQCSMESVMGGLMTFAQLGLRPGVMGQGWLIPFKKRVQIDRRWVDTWEAQIIIGYKGYSELIHRTGAAFSMVSRVVYEADDFDVEYGLNENIVHRPHRGGDRGEATDYYSVIKYSNGGHTLWHMTIDEMKAWRDRYAMARKPIWRDGKRTDEVEIVGPWRDQFDSMAMKTVFLRAANWAPKTTMLARAEAVDGAVRRDMKNDPDEMFFAEKPDPNVIDGEVTDDEPEREQITVTQAPDDPPAFDPDADDAPAWTKPDPAPAADDAELADQGQHKHIALLLRKGGITERPHRIAALSGLARRPIETGKEITKDEAKSMIDNLQGWDRAGNITENLAVYRETPAEPATDAAATPSPESDPQGWHDANHPRKGRGGKVQTADTDDQCEICTAPANES